jgi:asparagine synthase (glutamine-hydrolysing)
MSAILGRLNFNDAPIHTSDFEVRAQALKIWGPDQLDCARVSNSAFAQATLLIGPQAAFDGISKTKSGIIICADAIIDNRQELALAMKVTQVDLEALSDTQLIALAWEAWGQECVQHLVGDYAFSAADPLKKVVFLARDHIGTRPLYWAKRGDCLIWATSAEVIVSHQEWEWPLDEKAIIAFQANNNVPLPGTFYQDLKRLEPGHFVSVDRHAISNWRWWNPNLLPTIKLDSPEAYTKACRELLERAVRDRVHSALPIGAHLSGGIDSTGVAVMAARHLAEQGRTLCGGYAWSPPISETHPDMGHRDERRRITAVAEKEGIPVRFGSSDGANIFDFFSRPLEFEGIADLADEVPILLGAAKDSARTVLSGWGGDEAFSAHGYGYVGYLLLKLKFGAAANFIRGHTRTLKDIRSVLGELWWNGLHPMLPEPLYHFFYQFEDKDDGHTFMPMAAAQKNKKLIKERQRGLRFFANPTRNMFAHIEHGHLAMRMETWAAWAAPYRLQYRYPLTDRRLLEFLMSIPPEALFPSDRSRGLALAVMEGVIPRDVTKHDAANEVFRMQARGASWHITAEYVGDGLLSQDCPWFDMNKLRNAAINPADQSTTNGVLRFAELMSAMRLWFMWLRSKDKPDRV